MKKHFKLFLTALIVLSLACSAALAIAGAENREFTILSNTREHHWNERHAHNVRRTEYVDYTDDEVYAEIGMFLEESETKYMEMELTLRLYYEDGQVYEKEASSKGVGYISGDYVIAGAKIDLPRDYLPLFVEWEAAFYADGEWISGGVRAMLCNDEFYDLAKELGNMPDNLRKDEEPLHIEDVFRRKKAEIKRFFGLPCDK